MGSIYWTRRQLVFTLSQLPDTSGNEGMRTATIVFLGLALASASASVNEIPCICTREYMPVCGSDGVTYPNSCTFRCAAKANSDLKVVAEGECTHMFEKEVPCVCTLEYMPLCGSDGVTYPNFCTFKCKERTNDDLKIVSHGACKAVSLKAAKPLCRCTKEYNPMCGSDGQTYANPCLLKCQMKVEGGLALHSVGECSSAKTFAAVCACTREYRPLCGSDGRTYNNQCLLKCQQKVDNSLTASRKGRCEDVQVAAKKMYANECPCTREYNPVCGNDGETYDNACLLKCQQKVQPGLEMSRFGRCKTIPMAQMGRSAPMCLCTREYNPLCGSDGVTYNNECLLKCAQREQPMLSAVRHGRCEEQQVSRSAPMCLCTREYNPLCGSDGVTYNNECLLKCAQREQHTLTATRHGRCEDVQLAVRKMYAYECPCTRQYDPVCGNDGETYDNICLLTCQRKVQPGLKMARIGRCKPIPMAQMGRSAPMCFCTREYNPLCGSDGVTYNNECLLKCAQREQPMLSAVRHGRCEEQQKKALCACNRMLWPVCGSDGKTYSNPCLLKCEQKTNSGLIQVHEGECNTAIQLNAVHACPCPLIFRPVCGTDGNTYDNECALNCKATHGNAELKVFHQGACIMPFAKAGGPCACNKMYLPVCGTDGVSYNNPCLIGCQQRENSDLTIAHYGRCADDIVLFKKDDVCACTFDYRPVCGSDGKTYPNVCTFQCAQKKQNSLFLSYEGECVVPVPIEMACPCPRIYKPVCGTDGVTYDNECILNCKVKNGNSDLKVFHQGFCAVPISAKNDDVCACTDDYRPVCGSDVNTYPNVCTFQCSQKKQSSLFLSYEGECVPVPIDDDICICNRMYLPVCGSDGKTYDNPCVFECAQKKKQGLKISHYSEC